MRARHRVIFVIGLLPLSVFAQAKTGLAEMNTPVRIEAGLVSGARARDPVIPVFKGIPYAEPPRAAQVGFLDAHRPNQGSR